MTYSTDSSFCIALSMGHVSTVTQKGLRVSCYESGTAACTSISNFAPRICLDIQNGRARLLLPYLRGRTRLSQPRDCLQVDGQADNVDIQIEMPCDS
jgi:hypothetical protein